MDILESPYYFHVKKEGESIEKKMQVTVFKNISNEKNPSMLLYTEQLLKSMPGNVSSFSMYGKNYPFFKYYFTKEFIYPKIAAKYQADVNHIADHSYCGLLRTLDPAKTIVTCHDLIPLIYPKAVSKIGKARYWYNVKLLPKAKRIITASEFTKQQIIEIFGKGLKGKISVMPYGVSGDFRPIQDKDGLRRKYNISGKSILHIGSSYQRKNVELILEVLSKRKDWQFVKIGPFNKSQIKYIKNNNLTGRIIHFPFINLADTKKVAQIYNCAGCLAYPSFCEGFGLPLIEAMACGCPVVCSEIPPFKEITEAVAVFINPNKVDSLEAGIERALEDNAFADMLSHKGLAASKKYTWQDCADKTYKIYEEVYNLFCS